MIALIFRTRVHNNLVPTVLFTVFSSEPFKIDTFAYERRKNGRFDDWMDGIGVKYATIKSTVHELGNYYEYHEEFRREKIARSDNKITFRFCFFQLENR